MTVHANENDGAVTLTVDGRHRTLKLEDAEELLEDLEKAVADAKNADE